jgi:hypothetical protein
MSVSVDIINPAQRKTRGYAKWPKKFDFENHINLKGGNDGKTVAEFVGSDDFASQFYTRQQYEIDAGRDEVPLLYQSIYNVIEDANLPKTVNLNILGPAGVVLEAIKEGGEVKFASVGESSLTATMVHYAVGLAYTKDLFVYNETWNFPILERQFGQANNALLNDIHLNPILAYSYAAANQTAAATGGANVWENVMLTIEAAIEAAKADTTNPRRGPYDLIIAGSDQFKVERALLRRIQDGIDEKTSAVSMLQNIIVYDGWTATRGKDATSYSGVSGGTAYLVSKQYQNLDFRSFVKQPLQSQRGDGDLSRFIVEQIVFDTYLTAYANPVAAVEEITWPVPE